MMWVADVMGVWTSDKRCGLKMPCATCDGKNCDFVYIRINYTFQSRAFCMAGI